MLGYSDGCLFKWSKTGFSSVPVHSNTLCCWCKNASICIDHEQLKLDVTLDLGPEGQAKSRIGCEYVSVS